MVAAVAAVAVRDYRAWRRLGPGGLPANPWGWAAVTFLRLLVGRTRSTARYDRASSVGAPLVLPPRRGPRPVLGRHPVPHRQLDQLPGAELRAAAAALTAEVAAAAPGALALRTSRYERHGDAVVAVSAKPPGWLHGSGGEAGHVHASDGSLHLVLQPADAAAAIEAGWAERHPLSGRRGLGLPDHYLLVYAPRDPAELDVVRLLYRRAAGLL